MFLTTFVCQRKQILSRGLNKASRRKSAAQGGGGKGGGEGVVPVVKRGSGELETDRRERETGYF